jgi:enamine deaminase RidA (YjgF/YER057c/UK114 family)
MTTIETIQLDESKAHWLPYAPVVKVSGPMKLYFLSDIGPIPTYHRQPLSRADAVLPDDIREQARMTFQNLSDLLASHGLGWQNVVKVLEFLKDMREADAVHATMGEFFGGSTWFPANTMVQVDNFVAAGARLQYDVIAAGPLHP